MLQRYTEALTDFNCILELNPEDDWCLYNRALTYQKLNQPDIVSLLLRGVI